MENVENKSINDETHLWHLPATIIFYCTGNYAKKNLRLPTSVGSIFNILSDDDKDMSLNYLLLNFYFSFIFFFKLFFPSAVLMLLKMSVGSGGIGG